MPYTDPEQESAPPVYAATARDWWAAARPHTWANAFAPVLAGSAAAAWAGSFQLGRALLALVVAWALIIGVNYANDYSDGIRGTDDVRSGPTRLTAAGLASPAAVKTAAFLTFGVAAIAGIGLSLLSAWWLIALGALCIVGAWFYTGGKNPYGYRGLGEIAIFVFFGLVAVLGTEFTQSGAISWVGVAFSVGVGCFSSAVNLSNNLRDIPTDAAAGKITLAVRLGDKNTRRLFVALLTTPYVLSVILSITVLTPAILGLISAIFALAAVSTVRRGAQGVELIPVLSSTGQALLSWAVITGGIFALNA